MMNVGTARSVPSVTMIRTLQALTTSLLALLGGWSLSTWAQPPQLQVFYSVHAHFPAGGGGRGFVDADPRADPAGARLAAEGLDQLARTLERHGAKGSFHLTAQMAEAVCTVAGQRSLARDLVARGHEVGAHGHGATEIAAAVQALVTHCGVQVDCGSGILSRGGFGASGGPGGRPMAGGGSAGGDAAAVASQTRQVAALGIEVLTMNATPKELGPSRYYRACGGHLGQGNDDWSTRGALRHPWRPDAAGGEVCGHHPGAPVVFLDHASGDWMRTAGGGVATVDTLGDRHFDTLRVQVGAALQGWSGTAETWGFVSHLHEYMVGGKVMSELSPGALASLERFLVDVGDQGGSRLSWATASEIAAAVQ